MIPSRTAWEVSCGLAATAGVVGGVLANAPLLTFGAAAAGVGALGVGAARRGLLRRAGGGRRAPEPEKACSDPAALTGESLVESLLAQGRVPLLLRPAIVGNLSPEQLRRTRSALDQAAAFNPAGDVLLRTWTSAAADPGEEDRSGDRVVRVEPFFLDRRPVTNARYMQFVRDGGYQQMTLWNQEIWSGILEFVDQTGCPGPRFWRHGAYPAGAGETPVVGVCWYEAAAFARWAGMRLPSDAEWVKAASWPVPAEDGPPLQRRFPWGDAMDRAKANLWGSGPDALVPVGAFPGGMSTGGVDQLVGNVWEWTLNSFGAWETATGRLELPAPMKTIRGGAFDTYFDRQASCQFPSGDSPLARKHNLGFRCAVGAADLAAWNDDEAALQESSA